MTKATIQRQKLIADFIDSGNISSQNQLKGMLKKNGTVITQATLSRDLNELVRADVTTKNKIKAKEIYENLDEMEKRIEEVKAKEELSKIRPALSGDEIMEHFNIQPGPKVGVIMKALYEQRINEGEVSKEDALKLAEETYKKL